MTAPLTPRQSGPILWCRCGQPVTADLCDRCTSEDAAMLNTIRATFYWAPLILFGLWVAYNILAALAEGGAV